MTTPPLLEIRDLHVAAEDGAILRGVDLTVGPGEVHALMGPNGAGKSTLAGALHGPPVLHRHRRDHPARRRGRHGWPTDVRAKAGLFLAFQYPETIEGVSVTQFLRQAMAARKDDEVSVLEVRVLMTEWMERLGMDTSFASRHLNQGFSGGEKKRNEILQMALLEPLVAVLDETDSGLDIDALRVVGRGVRAVREVRPELGRAGHHPLPAPARGAVPDAVHILVDGRIVASGGPELAARGRGRRLRGVAMTRQPPRGSPAAPERRGPAQGLPPPAAHGARPADRLSRLGRLAAAAGSRHRRHEPLLRDHPRQRPPRRLRHGGGGHRPLRTGRGWRRGASSAHRTPAHEIVFTKNTTEALNLVAQSWGARQPGAGRRGAADRDGAPRQHRAVDDPAPRRSGGLELRYIPVDDEGRLALDDLDRLLDGVKLVGVSTMSNVLGTINPVRDDRRRRPRAGRVVVADGAQLGAPRADLRAPTSAPTSSPSRPTR